MFGKSHLNMFDDPDLESKTNPSLSEFERWPKGFYVKWDGSHTLPPLTGEDRLTALQPNLQPTSTFSSRSGTQTDSRSTSVLMMNGCAISDSGIESEHQPAANSGEQRIARALIEHEMQEQEMQEQEMQDIETLFPELSTQGGLAFDYGDCNGVHESILASHDPFEQQATPFFGHEGKQVEKRGTGLVLTKAETDDVNGPDSNASEPNLLSTCRHRRSFDKDSAERSLAMGQNAPQSTSYLKGCTRCQDARVKCTPRSRGRRCFRCYRKKQRCVRE